MEDGETLVIDGFRFVSVKDKKELKKLSSQSRVEKCEARTSSHSGRHPQCHQKKKTKKGGKRKAKK